MRRLQIGDISAASSTIDCEIAGSEEGRYHHRLHGVLLICRGFSCSDVAQAFGCSVRTVHNWIRRFEQDGPDGLRDGPHPGRPAVLDECTRRQLQAELRRSPRRLGYEQDRWDGKLLHAHIKQAYGAAISVRQCQRLFHQLGIRKAKYLDAETPESAPELHATSEPRLDGARLARLEPLEPRSE